jgi:hypothetical protein
MAEVGVMDLYYCRLLVISFSILRLVAISRRGQDNSLGATFLLDTMKVSSEVLQCAYG